MKHSTPATLLLMMVIGLYGCVTVHNQDGSKTTWNPIEQLGKAISRKTDPVDVYLATFDSESWDLWDKIRQNPGSREALSAGTIRVKILAEAFLLISRDRRFPVNSDDELSIAPAIVYEGLLEDDRNTALAFLDFISQNRAFLHRELNGQKRIKAVKQFDAKIDRWLKDNG